MRLGVPHITNVRFEAASVLEDNSMKPTMYLIVVIAILAVVVADDKFTTAYDNIDIDVVIKNERLLGNYFKCLLDKGKCTPDGLELKKNLPEAIQSDCLKCSKKQKEMTSKILKFLIHEKKDWYSELEAKYDPEAKYREKYTKLFIAEE